MITEDCDIAPEGWRCNRIKGHKPPCAAVPMHAIDVLGDAQAELEMLRELFHLQFKRMGEAAERWRAEDPKARALVMPDLGDLLEWLMADADKARLEAKEAYESGGMCDD